MKKILIASFTFFAVFQFGATIADFKVVKNPEPGQKIYWTMQNNKVSPCAWYEVWEVLAIQNDVVKLKKVKAPSISFSDDEEYLELDKLNSWSSEEDAKMASGRNRCHLRRKFEGANP